MPWGVFWDRGGNAQAGLDVTLKNLDGTAATHWSAVSGGSSATSTLTTDADGTLPRYIEAGTYLLTAAGLGVTDQRVEAAAGPDTLGGIRIVSPTVASGFTYRVVNKDGIIFIDNLTDASGSGSSNFMNVIGGYGTKTGTGTINWFWASLTHKSSGEAGISIGDITVPSDGAGGNIWGYDYVFVDQKGVQMYGGRLSFNPQVARGGKTANGHIIENLSATYTLDQAVRVLGKWDRPFIAYSDAAGTTAIFDVDSTGKVRSGHHFPMGNSTFDFGDISNRWRTIFVNNVAVNGADGAGGGGNVAIKNTAAAPSGTPSAGGVLYAEAGALKWKGSSGTVTTVAVA